MQQTDDWPDPEIAQATEIVEAFQKARSRGEAAVRLAGKFIDPPVVRWAQNVLAMRDLDAK